MRVRLKRQLLQVLSLKYYLALAVVRACDANWKLLPDRQLASRAYHFWRHVEQKQSAITAVYRPNTLDRDSFAGLTLHGLVQIFIYKLTSVLYKFSKGKSSTSEQTLSHFAHAKYEIDTQKQPPTLYNRNCIT